MPIQANMKKSILPFFIFLFILSFNVHCQQSLNLSTCAIVEYPINDHSDSNDNGVVCEAMITLTNSSSYENDEICQLSDIHWIVIVDLNSDGVDDLEFSSELPSDDTDLDDTNGNGIPDLYIPMTTNNQEQSIELPEFVEGVSDHTVFWSAFDDCGLSDQCNTSFAVRDKKSPTAYCVASSTFAFGGFDFEIYAEDFNVGSFDNCTDQENIRYSFSGDSIVPTRLVTCYDVINSPISVNMYAWDDFDNVDYCTVFLTLIPGPTVDCFDGGLISGKVKGWKGDPIEGVEITLDANAMGFPISTFTDTEGNYSFGFHENSLEYSLSASYDTNYLDGVSTLDLVLIARHILGLQPFLNPYQILAADINGDNTIKVNDLAMHRKLILGVISELPSDSPWNFLRSDFEFMDPLDPFPSLMNSSENPFSYEFDNVNNGGYDFIGFKIGDVNN